MGSGASKEELASKHVLIIGGGYAGITVRLYWTFYCLAPSTELLCRQQQS